MNIRLIIILLILPLFLGSNTTEKELSITFTGDVILDRGVNDKLKMYGDSILLSSLKKYNKQDYFIINFEGTFSDLNKIQVPESDNRKKYIFKADQAKASLLSQGGITHASVANNHSRDFGDEGFNTTLKTLTDNNITPLGENLDPVLFIKGKCKCAILSVSLLERHNKAFIKSINKLKQKVKEFSDKYPAIPLILYIHWGLELQNTPEKWQKDLAEDLVRSGTDAIIGHHPHVVQTIEFIKGKPVLYSIGNFIADAYMPLTTESIIVNLKIRKEIEEINLIPVDLKDYFPERAEQKKQIEILKNILKYSNNIGVINYSQYWQLKDAEDINFKEASNLWLFSASDYVVAIRALKSGLKLLNLLLMNTFSNTITLHGKLSELTIADIDNNGNDDIILGIEKRVNFDPVNKKRINIYTYYENNLEPLWLGTKFIYDIVSFNVFINDRSNFLNTIESDTSGNLYNGIYEWDNFGFALKTIKPKNKKE